MASDSWDRWARQFLKDAAADDYRLLRELLQQIESSTTPEQFASGTVDLVRASCSYFGLDGQAQRKRDFLTMQQYDPAGVTGTDYMIAFVASSDALGRLLAPADLRSFDLADLFDHRWDEIEAAGFTHLYFSRLDGKDISNEELDRIEKTIEGDIYFDYDQEEVNISCTHHGVDGRVECEVRERTPEEIEEWNSDRELDDEEDPDSE